MTSRVKADVESLENHVKNIRWKCEAMLDASKKFSSKVSNSIWSDNVSEYALGTYETLAHSIENVMQVLDGASVILESQTMCLREYYNVKI